MSSEPTSHSYAEWMARALDVARSSGEDVPVGALVLRDEVVIGSGVNRRLADHDPTAHAEVVALRDAARHTGSWRLDDCTLIVTLEPCPMCAGAALQARIGRLVFGAWDPKGGACGSMWDLVGDGRAMHRLDVVSGVLAGECGRLLSDFFAARRLR